MKYTIGQSAVLVGYICPSCGEDHAFVIQRGEWVPWSGTCKHYVSVEQTDDILLVTFDVEVDYDQT